MAPAKPVSSFSRTLAVALVAEKRGTGTAGDLEKLRDGSLQEIVFQGDLLDLSSGFIFPTQERFASIRDKILKVTRHEAASLILLHSLMGSIASTEKILPFGRFHVRSLQLLIN